MRKRETIAKRASAKPNGLPSHSSRNQHRLRQVASAWHPCELASEGWWGKKDSNLRSHKTADLQSAPFATRATPPLNSIETPTGMAANRPWMTLKPGADGGHPVERVYGVSDMAKSTKAGALNAVREAPELPLTGTRETSPP